VLVAAGIAVGVKVVLAHATGPAHVLVMPSRVDGFVRRAQLEQQINARQLQREVISRSGGQVRHVLSAVYQKNGNGHGTSPDIVLFIGGHLSGVSPSGFISSFTSEFRQARPVAAGALGGSAACASNQAGAVVALCAWADNDTFGLLVSPTLPVAELSGQMHSLRAGVEHVAR
jgi:hypothetical protein